MPQTTNTGLSDIPFLTSDTIQKLDAIPSRLLVLGAGYIGLELAQMMHRFGSKVTVLERGSQILSHEDVEVAGALANCLQGEGVEIQLSAAVEQIDKFSDGQISLANIHGAFGLSILLFSEGVACVRPISLGINRALFHRLHACDNVAAPAEEGNRRSTTLPESRPAIF